MKKIIALTSALAICTVNLVTFSANAMSTPIYVIGNDVFSRYEEDALITKILTPHIDFDAVFTCIDDSGVYPEYYVAFYYEEGTEVSQAYMYYDTYRWITQDEADTLSGYLAESYPDITLNLEETSYAGDTAIYKLDYGKDITKDEQREIAEAIFDNTGLRFDYMYLLSSVTNISRIGDLDSDGTVNALDASSILTYYSDSQTGNTDTYTDEDIADITLLGDYDADGAVNALDASLVLKEYAETQTNC